MDQKYTRLKLKMLVFVVLGAGLAAVLGVLVMEYMVKNDVGGPLQSLYLWASQTVFGHTALEAAEGYARHIGDHREEIVLAGMVVLMLVGFYLAMGRFTRWLNQIGAAVRRVVAGEETPVTLPRELGPIQGDLGELQKILADQAAEREENLRRKGDLVAFLAHDLKTPLTSVVGYLRLLWEKPELTADQKSRYVGIALDKALRLEELLGEFFDISRMDLQPEDVPHTKIQLSILLEQLADEFWPIFAEKQLTCQTNIAPGLTVTGNPDKLARVFDNILRNAVSYSVPGGTVELTAQPGEGTVEISISNQGMEIPEQELSNIFRKFYRLDAARSTRTGGAGLGLAIAKEIVDHHGGTIRAESDGKKAVFHISLPGEGVF